MTAELPSVDTSATSRKARESVFLSAVVTRFGDREQTKHRVRNLSTEGACIDVAGDLKPFETIIVEIGSLRGVGAKVKWVSNDKAGLEFMHPIEVTDAKARPKPIHVLTGWNRVP